MFDREDFAGEMSAGMQLNEIYSATFALDGVALRKQVEVGLFSTISAARFSWKKMLARGQQAVQWTCPLKEGKGEAI